MWLRTSSIWESRAPTASSACTGPILESFMPSETSGCSPATALGVQFWVMLHKYHWAACHGACVHRFKKKPKYETNPKPTNQNKNTPFNNSKNLYVQRWPRGIPGQVFCGISGLLFSVLMRVERGTMVHKCDLLTQR